MKIAISEEKEKGYLYDTEWKKRFALLPKIIIEDLHPLFERKLLVWFEWYFINEKLGGEYLINPNKPPNLTI